MQYTGRNRWQCVEGPLAGQEKVTDNFEKTPDARAGHFMVAYLAEIINLIDRLGNKKMQVVKYMLAHMNKSDNSLIITTRELAQKSKVSINVVTDTLKLLEASGIIKRRTGAIMISPKLINNKTARGEASMMITYREFKEEPINITPEREALPAPEDTENE